MPPRQSDQRRTTSGDGVREASARLEELRSDVSKGSGALRNRFRQTVSLSPSSQVPLLVPRQADEPVDAAVAFYDGEVRITGPDGTGARDFVVRNLVVQGDVQVAGRVRAEGDVRAGGVLGADGSFTVGTIAGTGAPFVYSPARNVGIVAGGDGNLYVRDNFDAAAKSIFAANVSERDLKDEVGPLNNALATVMQWRPARFTWKPGTGYDHDPRVRAAIYVNELDESTDGLAVATTDPNGNRVPDDRAQIAYLAAAVQELAAQLREARAEVTALRAHDSV